MTTTTDLDRVKEKIRKLLALAMDPSAEGAEAETASRQAAKLMARYELDEYDLAGGKAAIHDFDLTTGEAVGTRPGKRNAREVPLWIRLIASGVKIYCGCRLFVNSSSVQFAGRRSDVELAVWMHNTLVTQCYERGRSETVGQGQSAANAWRNGYAGQIQLRLKRMRAEREEAEREEVSSSGTALVLVRNELENAMTESFGAPAKSRTVNCNQSLSGRAAGASAHIPQHRPLN